MAELELIGIPFDGYGRAGNQTRASSAMRDAGFLAAFGEHRVARSDDIELPAPDPSRAAGSGLVNEAALLAMVDEVDARVAAALRGGRFTVLYGADCTTLLGSVSALRDSAGSCGLLFIDGHEDTMPLDVSEDGEAANTEIGLLLGLTGHFAPDRLRSRLPALDADGLALLGQRDAEWRREFNVGSLRDRGVFQRSVDEIAEDPAGLASAAVLHLREHAPDWWLHIDLDVLDPAEFAAQGVPGGEDEPGGLTWAQLTEIAVAAAEMDGCRGWSVTIYDPDQDPDGTDARAITRLAAAVASVLR